MAKIEVIVAKPDWYMDCWEIMHDKCRGFKTYEDAESYAITMSSQKYDIFFIGRNQKWVSFEIGDRREDIEQQMNGSYMSPAFKRYLKTRRRNQTLRRKMERETKELNRRLWEVFGI